MHHYVPILILHILVFKSLVSWFYVFGKIVRTGTPYWDFLFGNNFVGNSFTNLLASTGWAKFERWWLGFFQRTHILRTAVFALQLASPAWLTRENQILKGLTVISCRLTSERGMPSLKSQKNTMTYMDWWDIFVWDKCEINTGYMNENQFAPSVNISASLWYNWHAHITVCPTSDPRHILPVLLEPAKSHVSLVPLRPTAQKTYLLSGRKVKKERSICTWARRRTHTFTFSLSSTRGC